MVRIHCQKRSRGRLQYQRAPYWALHGASTSSSSHSQRLWMSPLRLKTKKAPHSQFWATHLIEMSSLPCKGSFPQSNVFSRSQTGSFRAQPHSQPVTSYKYRYSHYSYSTYLEHLKYFQYPGNLMILGLLAQLIKPVEMKIFLKWFGPI